MEANVNALHLMAVYGPVANRYEDCLFGLWVTDPIRKTDCACGESGTGFS